MSRINACSACFFRYDPSTQPEKAKQCCYETCATFYGIEGVEDTPCGKACQKCIKVQIPKERVYGQVIRNRFKDCLVDADGDILNALDCCLETCPDYKCQERCIDAYNSLKSPPYPITENFTLNRSSNALIVLGGLGILVYILIRYKKSIRR